MLYKKYTVSQKNKGIQFARLNAFVILAMEQLDNGELITMPQHVN